MDKRSMMSKAVSFTENPLDLLSDANLISLIHSLEEEKLYVELENHLFKEFILANDQSLLDTIKRPDIPDLNLPRMSIQRNVSSVSMIDAKAPGINVSQKLDMLTKYMEDVQYKLDTFLKISRKELSRLRAELEELNMRGNEIKESRDMFEFNVVVQGIDQLTQRIPAEKFIKFMEDLLKSATLNIEKLRLRTASLRVQYGKVKTTLIQRKELGENVHPVDFDQLEIENKHFLLKLDQKNIHLLELKKMNGQAHLILSKHKKYLHKQGQDNNRLKASLTENEKTINVLEKECDLAEVELEKVQEKYETMLRLIDTYTVPDVMEYVQVKSELFELKKNLKIWFRRNKIQDIALNSCIRQMRDITGSKFQAEWVEDDSKSVAPDQFFIE